MDINLFLSDSKYWPLKSLTDFSRIHHNLKGSALKETLWRGCQLPFLGTLKLGLPRG